MQYLTNFAQENSNGQNFPILGVSRRATTIIAGLKLEEKGDIYQGYFKKAKKFYVR